MLPEVKVVSELSFVVLLNHDGLGSTLRKIPCLTSNWVKGQMPLEKKKFVVQVKGKCLEMGLDDYACQPPTIGLSR